jgi:hypothetical protein
MSRIGELSRTDVWIPLFKQMKDLDDQKLEYQEQLSGLQSQLEDVT